ncbi:hypothetical protein HOH45_06555 [bacterium]|jgi:hypothetical protein|nr:hypothetical protein [bacterium]
MKSFQKFTQKSLFVCLFVTTLFLSTNCGKVTQDLSKAAVIPSVDLSFTLPVSPTVESSKTIKIESITRKNSPLFFQIQGIKPDGSSEELSWGKGLILSETIEDKTASGDVTVKVTYKSSSYTKSNIEIKRSNLSETHLTYQSAKNKWVIKSNKIKKGFPWYLVQAYSSKDKYRFKLLTGKVVTGNTRIDFGEITPYDTFIGTLYRSIASHKNMSFDETILASIEKLYTNDFYLSLNAELPLNTIKKFNPKTPLFEIDSILNNTLLDLLNLVHTDKKEALSYLEKKEITLILPKKAIENLTQTLDAFF